MQNVSMEISLTLKGPILTQSSNPGELGLDMVVARNYKGVPYLPNTLISGKLRQALDELVSVTSDDTKQATWFKPKLDIWLGKSSENSLPKTKQLYFSDFVLKDLEELNRGIIRDRISINSETGAVEEHHILMMESPF